MSNSPLVTYTRLSPNCTKPRRGKIQYIVPHCIVGQWTARYGCDYFAGTKRQASANYVVGRDGSIGLCVDEANRAWTTGGDLTVNGITGADIDHSAVTIEVASDTAHPYAITGAAYDALVRLMADIAKRNGIRELRWKADKSLAGHPEKQNVLVHRWFASKACPGDYMYSRMGDIVEKANKLLKGGDDMTKEEVEEIVKAEVKAAVKEALDEANPVYKDLEDVPPYWKAVVSALLRTGAVNGGTPEGVNATDINLRLETLKAAVIAAAYAETLMGKRLPDPPAETRTE